MNLNELLESWNLKHLSPFLEEESVDIETLKNIQGRHLSTLTRMMFLGDAIAFEMALKDWRKSINIPIDIKMEKSVNISLHAPRKRIKLVIESIDENIEQVIEIANDSDEIEAGEHIIDVDPHLRDEIEREDAESLNEQPRDMPIVEGFENEHDYLLDLRRELQLNEPQPPLPEALQRGLGIVPCKSWDLRQILLESTNGIEVFSQYRANNFLNPNDIENITGIIADYYSSKCFWMLSIHSNIFAGMLRMIFNDITSLENLDSVQQLIYSKLLESLHNLLGAEPIPFLPIERVDE